MATVAQNNLRKKVRGLHMSWLVDTTATFNQGDLLYFDTTTKNVKVIATDGNAATLVGVALQSFPVTSLGVGDGFKRIDSMEVGWGDLFDFNTTSGDTYTDGDKVYIGADAQTVTNTAGAMVNYLGIYRKIPDTGAVAGGAGVVISVEVFRRYPDLAET